MPKLPTFAFRDKQPTFGTSTIRIVIEVDEKGLMRTSINKPLPSVQILGLLLDSMNGQYAAMRQQASLLIDPHKDVNDGLVRGDGGRGSESPERLPDAGQKEENDNNSGGHPSGGEPVIG